MTLEVDVDRWLSYKGTCQVILLPAKLHDMYLYKTATFPHQPLLKVSLKDGNLPHVSLYPYNIFLFLHENICCGYSLAVPQQSTSNEYVTYVFIEKKEKKQYFSVEKSTLSEAMSDYMNVPVALGFQCLHIAYHITVKLVD